MLPMLKNFVKIAQPIKKALTDLNLIELWNEDYVSKASNILKTLEPIQLTIESLSRKDATLLSAEGALKFLFQELEQNESELSQEMLERIKFEIDIRRNSVLVGLLKYLTNPQQVPEDNDIFFTNPPKTKMLSLAKQLLSRLFEKNTEEISSNKTQTVNSDDIRERLKNAINAETTPASSSIEAIKTIDKEFKLFETTKKPTENIKLLQAALLTIKPTSTQNERNFSVAADFVTKKRNRLSDSIVDILCFLKNYFRKK